MSLSTSETIVAVGTVSGVFLAANPNRVGLIISAPATNRITITKLGTAVDGNGLRLHPGQLPTQLFVSTVGNWFQGALNCIANVGAETIGVLEVLQS